MKGKKLPDTILSRAIIIEMKRKQADERVQDFNHLDNSAFEVLRRKQLRWAADNAGVVSKARPQLPDGFHNRTRANWVPLFAIAELAGDKVAEQLGEAAKAIERAKDKTDGALGILLLVDIRKLFESEGKGLSSSNKVALSSSEIVDKLKEDEEAPWCTFATGKPITQRQLANLLRPFGITSVTVYPNPSDRSYHVKGYKRSQFEDAWQRYLSPEDEGPKGTSDRSGYRVNPTNAGKTRKNPSGSDPGETRIEDDELSGEDEPSPATRFKKGTRSREKKEFKYDLGEKQAKARAAIEAIERRNKRARPQ
jgi:hypothetical protein